MEARGTDSAGGRVFRVRIIAYGDSKNGRRYSEAVMRAAVPLYQGAKAYDRHRDETELRSSTIAGLVGSYRNVTAADQGLEADLHLLLSATHTAEALEASLAAQAEGLPPLVGVSHDVMGTYRAITQGGKRVAEATAIVKVNSADIVADPAAGGQAVRMVAGGADDEPEESLHDRSTARGRAVIAQEASARGLPGEVADKLTATLPDRFSEAQLAAAIDAALALLATTERAGLAPTFGARVTRGVCARRSGPTVTTSSPVERAAIAEAMRSTNGGLTTRGRSTDDGSWTTLLVVHEDDGSWTFHGLGAPGVTLPAADMVALAESILKRAR